MISLIHPSRGRPQKSFENAKNWVERAGCEVELIVSIDRDEPTNDLVGGSKYITLYNGGNFNAHIISNNNKSVVEATNLAARESKGDILLYLSDDFKCFDNWGLSVEKEFEGEDRPLLIKVDDCLQKF